MKRIIILLSIFMCATTFAQRGYVSGSIGFDVKNSFVGSKPTNNNPSLDILLKATAVGNKGFEVSAVYERFQQINFEKYAFSAGYNFPLYAYIGRNEIKTNILFGLEPTIIHRWSTWGGGISWNQDSSFLTMGANVGARWFVNDHLGFEILYNPVIRQDLAAMYGHKNTGRLIIGDAPVVGNTYLVFIYKIDR